MNYCNRCGSPVVHHIPDGDDKPRFVCMACQMIHYENPKMVVGCIPVWKNSILFCRRAIEPCYGKWTIPAGFLENGETVAEGAKRETFEEARAKVDGLEPFGMYDLTFVNQIYFIFRANLINLDFGAGDESLDVCLFSEHDIPWDELAFPVIREALIQYVKDSQTGVFSFHTSSILPE